LTDCYITGNFHNLAELMAKSLLVSGVKAAALEQFCLMLGSDSTTQSFFGANHRLLLERFVKPFELTVNCM
jgi:hypothetical protein